MVPTRPFSLNVHHEWRTAGGFHALCHDAHQSPQVTAMVKCRVWCGDPPDSFWDPLTHQWIWLRSRWQGVVHQPMRWMVSWMPSSVWDRKFSHDTPLTADLSSFAWQAENHDTEDVLIIQRFWGLYYPTEQNPIHSWGTALPAFRQTVWTTHGICWELAQGVLRPECWTHIPGPSTEETFLWPLSHPV